MAVIKRPTKGSQTLEEALLEEKLEEYRKNWKDFIVGKPVLKTLLEPTEKDSKHPIWN